MTKLQIKKTPAAQTTLSIPLLNRPEGHVVDVSLLNRSTLVFSYEGDLHHPPICVTKQISDCPTLQRLHQFDFDGQDAIAEFWYFLYEHKAQLFPEVLINDHFGMLSLYFGQQQLIIYRSKPLEVQPVLFNKLMFTYTLTGIETTLTLADDSTQRYYNVATPGFIRKIISLPEIYRPIATWAVLDSCRNISYTADNRMYSCRANDWSRICLRRIENGFVDSIDAYWINMAIGQFPGEIPYQALSEILYPIIHHINGFKDFLSRQATRMRAGDDAYEFNSMWHVIQSGLHMHWIRVWLYYITEDPKILSKLELGVTESSNMVDVYTNTLGYSDVPESPMMRLQSIIR